MFPAGCTDPSSVTTMSGSAGVPRSAPVHVYRAGEERGLGEDLGPPALRRDDGHAGDAVRGRSPGTRIDEVMARSPVGTDPCPLGSPARRDRAGLEQEISDLALPGRVGRRSRRPRRPPSGVSPAARRSPPTLTSAPRAPLERSSATTRSAANPFPIPPGSKVVFEPSRTVPDDAIEVNVRRRPVCDARWTASVAGASASVRGDPRRSRSSKLRS